MLFILVLTIIYASVGTAQEICPEGSTLCFDVINQPMSWVDADDYCLRANSQLAFIDNVPDDILSQGNVDSLWLRTLVDPPADQEWTWLEGGPVPWANEITVSQSDSSNIRNCLAMKYHIQGKSWPAEDCEQAKNFICETEHGRECRITKKGIDYMGTTSSVQDETCRPWADVGALLQDTFIFTDGDPATAQNYCRNPDEALGPWCFVDSTTGSFRYCTSIPTCAQVDNSCFSLPSGEFSESAVYCTGGKCYIAIDTNSAQTKTWLEAQYCCNSINANLVTFDNQQNANDVYDNLLSHFAVQRMTTMWIGGFNRDWDSLTASSSNYIVKCFALEQNGLISKPCSETKPFVCERDQPTTTTTTPATTTTTTTTTITSATATDMPSPTPTITNNLPTNERNTNVNDVSSTAPASSTSTTVTTSNSVNTATDPVDGITTTDLNGSSEKKSKDDNNDDSALFMYIGIGAGGGLLLLIILIVAIVCACRPKKKKQKPFSLYSHQIYSASPDNTSPRDTYYDNQVFEENSVYDTTDATSHYSTPHYDVPSNGQPVHYANSKKPSDKAVKHKNKKSIENPLYNEGRESLYSQPSKKGKSQPMKKERKEAETSQAPEYAELPDLPPREYSGNDSQTSNYYNY